MVCNEIPMLYFVWNSQISLSHDGPGAKNNICTIINHNFCRLDTVLAMKNPVELEDGFPAQLLGLQTKQAYHVYALPPGYPP